MPYRFMLYVVPVGQSRRSALRLSGRVSRAGGEGVRYARSSTWTARVIEAVLCATQAANDAMDHGGLEDGAKTQRVAASLRFFTPPARR